MLLVVGFFVVPQIAFGAPSIDFPTSFADFSSQDLKTIIENIVRIVLGFVGIIFILILLYGGIIWMTSGGNEQKIAQAKKIIMSAVIGLILTLSAYAIARLIIRSIEGIGNPPTSTSGGPPGGFGIALGAGALESHYPGRNAVGVPRNTNIFVTFKEAMQPGTICDPGPDGILGNLDDTVLEANVTVMDVNNAVTAADANNANPGTGVGQDNILEGIGCQPTDATNTTFKFDPPANLGRTSGDPLYQVDLTPAIMTAAGKPAVWPAAYSWKFTVSTSIDTTPPTVTSVVPLGPPAPFGIAIPRNTIVQVTFSEAVDPTTASGIFDAVNNFDNITLFDDTGTQIEGAYRIGNQYRTVEFISNEPCGINSCGLWVYCLPESVIDGTVTDAVTDMAGVSLDGENQIPLTFPSGNGTLGGDYLWPFQTSANIDLSAPFLTDREPPKVPLTGNVSLFNPLELHFNESLSVRTLISDNVYISSPLTDYWIEYDGDPDLNPLTTKSLVRIRHDRFIPVTTYEAGVNSYVNDLFQNCYFPAACDNDGDGALTTPGPDDPNGNCDFEAAECAF